MKRFVLLFIFSVALKSFGQTDSLEIIFSSDSVPPQEVIEDDVLQDPPFEFIDTNFLNENFYNEKEYIRYMCFFTGVDFGLVSLQNEKYPIRQKQSFSIRLNLVEYKKQLIENRFGVFSGITLSYQQIGFQDDFKFIQVNNQTSMLNDSVDYQKNQLRSFSVSIPFMFEINSKNTFEKNMHFAFGLQGGYRYANSTYHMHKSNEATLIRKNSEDINLNPYHLEACVRVGYQKLTFFASRSLTPLFTPNKFQTELYPIVVGLCIIPANTEPSTSDDFDF